MTTVYTSAVANGTVADLAGFLKICTFAFSGYGQNTGPWWPEVRPVSDYHNKQMAEIGPKLAELMTLEGEALEKAWKQSKTDYQAEFDKMQAVSHQTNARIGLMLAKVMAWTPSSKEYEPLKDFMIRQLKESIDEDRPLHWGKVPATAEEWRDDYIKSLKWSWTYAKKRKADEEERVAAQRAYIDGLRKIFGDGPADEPREDVGLTARVSTIDTATTSLDIAMKTAEAMGVEFTNFTLGHSDYKGGTPLPQAVADVIKASDERKMEDFCAASDPEFSEVGEERRFEFGKRKEHETITVYRDGVYEKTMLVRVGQPISIRALMR